MELEQCSDLQLILLTIFVMYFIMYKKHWWQEYRYLKGCFGIPMKFDSQEADEEYLKKNGIDYKGK